MLIFPAFNLLTYEITSLMVIGIPNATDVILRLPSSILLAISISPSRLNRGTLPISLRYNLTGSSVLPTSPGVRSISFLFSSSSTSSSSVSFNSSNSPSCSTPIFWYLSSSDESIMSMSMSPNIIIILSICSGETTSFGRALFSSS